MKIKPFRAVDVLYLGAGVVGITALGQMTLDHIDNTEYRKGARIFKKIGVYAGSFALGGLMAYTIASGNVAMDFADLLNKEIEYEDQLGMNNSKEEEA